MVNNALFNTAFVVREKTVFTDCQSGVLRTTVRMINETYTTGRCQRHGPPIGMPLTKKKHNLVMFTMYFLKSRKNYIKERHEHGNQDSIVVRFVEVISFPLKGHTICCVTTMLIWSFSVSLEMCNWFWIEIAEKSIIPMPVLIDYYLQINTTLFHYVVTNAAGFSHGICFISTQMNGCFR